MFNWFDDLVKASIKWQGKEAQLSQLRAILGELKSVSLPNGSEFNQNPDLEPAQHIHRTATPGWTHRTRASKFAVDVSWRHPARPKDKSPQSYWSAADLLGLFLSAMGPAPEGATLKNFYLPLLALYGRWCHRIAGNRGVDGEWQGGAGDQPFVFQGTWNLDSRTFGLGASLAGYIFEPRDDVGDWDEVLMGARFDLVGNFHNIKDERPTFAGVSFKWAAKKSISLVKDPINGTRFGNCGETYPFLSLLG
ncbi:hypothetical protein CDD83_8564 [Cordyceps sp. RAO-2017]|nr:hypothetical protein CDD83_8564 [Cordyceps sp. RAO-2017]